MPRFFCLPSTVLCLCRKVPRDLTEATLAGGTLSLISSIVMAYLFITNFSQYLTVETSTSVRLDESQEKKIQINFNVTLHHLPCRFASVDISDVMGTHLQVSLLSAIWPCRPLAAPLPPCPTCRNRTCPRTSSRLVSTSKGFQWDAPQQPPSR